MLFGLAPFVAVFVLFLIMLWPIQLRGGSDDTAQATAIYNMGRLKWLEMRMTTWQPRLVNDFAFSLFIFHLPAWKWINAAIMSLLLWIMTRWAFLGVRSPQGLTSAGGGTNVARAPGVGFLTLAVFTCLGWFMIHPNVITSGSVWFTGSFYYLWPTTAMLLGLTPFLLHLYDKRMPYPRVFVPLCVIFSVLAAFTEQTAAVQIGLVVLLLLRAKFVPQRIPRALYVHAIVLFAVGVAYFYFDFTSVRVKTGAELPLFPEFASYTFGDKLMLGINVYATHLLHISNIIFTVLLILAGWMAYRHLHHDTMNDKRRPFVLKLLVFLPAAWGLLNTVPAPWGYTDGTYSALSDAVPGAFGFGIHGWLAFLNHVPPISPSASFGTAVLGIVALLCVLSPFYLLFAAFSDTRDRFLACALYLASFLSGIIIGFSPSVWASESRPNYLSNFFLLLLLVMLVRSTMQGYSMSPNKLATRQVSIDRHQSRTSAPMIVALVILTAFAAWVFVLYLLVFATNTYWWY